MTLASKDQTSGHWNVEWFDDKNNPQFGAYRESSLMLDDGTIKI
jgi:hypothetical protein